MEEHHVTVEGDPFQWRGFCAQLGIKPLWIELSTFERQLMCAITRRADEAIRAINATGSFKIVRIKHEVQPHTVDCNFVETGPYIRHVPDVAEVKYYECHVKLDGPFRPAIRMASRDLFRAERWYCTLRTTQPFDPRDFVERVKFWASIADGWRGPSRVAGFEYEACVLDTNPELDARWSR